MNRSGGYKGMKFMSDHDFEEEKCLPLTKSVTVFALRKGVCSNATDVFRHLDPTGDVHVVTLVAEIVAPAADVVGDFGVAIMCSRHVVEDSLSVCVAPANCTDCLEVYHDVMSVVS